MLLYRNHPTSFAVLLTLGLVGSGIASTCRAAFINLTPTSGVNSNTSVALGDLVSGQVEGITVGDKKFTGFNYSIIGDMPLASGVNVLGFKDPSGNWGLSFHGAFLDMPGGTSSNALIRYIVEVTAPSQAIRITDAHLFLGGVGVGSNSFVTVDESFLETNQSLNAFQSTLGSGGQQLHDVTQIDPTQRKLSVAKNILAQAGANSVVPARANAVDQSFSQVPEPTAILLAVFGLATSAGFVRRRIR